MTPNEDIIQNNASGIEVQPQGITPPKGESSGEVSSASVKGSQGDTGAEKPSTTPKSKVVIGAEQPVTEAKPEAGVYTDTQGRPQFMPETVEEPDASYGSGKDKTIEDLVKEEANEDEKQPAANFSLNRTLGGVILARAIQRQIWLVLLITLFLIIYINNRYMCQKQTVVIDKLEKKLTETRYKATVCTSILTEKSRESNIINMLEAKGDSTLTIPNEPPYLIKVE